MLIPTNENTTLNKINTVQLPEQEDLLKFLEQVEIIIKEKSEDDNDRGYLGMSSIGDPCSRKLWFGFHFVTEKEIVSEKTRRIFNTGHIAEGFIKKDLNKVGIETFDAQKECVDIAGHFKGHIDDKLLGVIEAPKTIHLGEYKTHNDKNFKVLVKEQDLKKAHYKHYCQCQVYMHYQKLKRALYVAYNKNTSEYYIERIYYDDDFAKELIQKASKIIMATEPPMKEFSPKWYACKWCKHYSVCHDNETPLRNCRTCKEVDICDNGVWECGMDATPRTTKEQLVGCEFHKFGWGFENAE